MVINLDALKGGPVEVVHLNGKSLAGGLEGVDVDGKRVTLTKESGSQSVPFEEIRFVRFLTSSYLEASRGESKGGKKKYRISFIDGKSVAGMAFEAQTSPEGLHLFPIENNRPTPQIFIPQEVVREHVFFDNEHHAIPKRQPVKDGVWRLVEEEFDPLNTIKPGIGTAETVIDKKWSPDEVVVRSIDDLKARVRNHNQGRRERLGDFLVHTGLVTLGHLNEAISIQRRDPNQRLGEILVGIGATSPESIQMGIATKLGLPFARLRDLDFDTQAFELFPGDLAVKHRAIPVCLLGNDLVVAMADPLDREALEIVHIKTGRNIHIIVATNEDIEWAIDEYYSMTDDRTLIQELESAIEPLEDNAAIERLENLYDEKPLVRLVDKMMRDAVRRRASDIHVRPEENELKIFYRIDGEMTHIRDYDKRFLPGIVNRIKIISQMNIAERRLPQDGRARITDGQSLVDLRISVIPTVQGESVVIRILNPRSGMKQVSELGFSDRDQEQLVDLLNHSYGMFLVTGPTGSGKSTTLYSALNELIKQNVNIITVEDPVEYRIAGIEQIHVNTAPGYTFAEALRHILRHDPDVIMVGEMRDSETARIGIQSALTGHLVLSTLHTNDAASSVTRFFDMGIEPYLLSSTLLGVLAQRLVRVNCPYCLEEEEVDKTVLRALGVGEDEVFYKGVGCDHCHGTGVAGRMAVYELLCNTSEMRLLIKNGAPAEDIEVQARKDGMVSLTENALRQARLRKISLMEVYRVRLE